MCAWLTHQMQKSRLRIAPAHSGAVTLISIGSYTIHAVSLSVQCRMLATITHRDQATKKEQTVCGYLGCSGRHTVCGFLLCFVQHA